MAMDFAASAISAFCASVKPVVPMTAFTPCCTQTRKWASVPSGRVKSIRHWLPAKPASKSAVMVTPVDWPPKAPASWPRAELLAMSSAPENTQSPLARTASTSIWPMRPLAPATQMRKGVSVVVFMG